ncbi:MAG: ATP synthase F1 subunit delta [Flavobacteriales bacterium]|nr:ATP synthase F1 subunit delta [Flavobacteriales bacterium]|tara:strand:- start:1111 stop:1641 length:531 start_codon:yes stop_codon:yes gene_type:complete
MLNNKASYRYAQALFSLAQEKQLQDAILNDCKLLLNEFYQTEELFTIVKNPTINKVFKKQIFEKIFLHKIGKETMNFISFLLKRGRESLLPIILENYNFLYNKEKNIIVAEVVSSKPLDTSLINTIKEKIGVLGAVNLNQKIDPKIIGGFIIKIGDLQYDASIKKQINNVKRAFKI